MTVCITAFSDDDDKIVAVCDRLLSGDIHSIEASATKIVRFCGTWVSCYAGDPSHAQTVLTSAATRLASEPEAEAVVEAFRNAYSEHRIACIEQEKLSAFGMNMKTFLSEGLANLGETIFERVFEEVRCFYLNLAFLIAGWGKRNDTMDWEMFTIENPGAVKRHSIIGTHAIGEGAHLALGHMYATYEKYSSIQETAYRALEAKFIAEATRSVGPATLGYVLSKNGAFDAIPYADIDAMHKRWTEKRRQLDPEIARIISV